MEHVLSLKCLVCGKSYKPAEIEYVCPDHGHEGIVEVQYDYDLISRRLTQGDLLHSTNFTIWRYKALLPVQPQAPVPPLSVGWTPLYNAPRMAEQLGLRQVWVKDDGRNPPDAGGRARS